MPEPETLKEEEEKLLMEAKLREEEEQRQQQALAQEKLEEVTSLHNDCVAFMRIVDGFRRRERKRRGSVLRSCDAPKKIKSRAKPVSG